jgi:hypothetical protein
MQYRQCRQSNGIHVKLPIWTRKQIPDFATQRAPIQHQQFSLSLTARINYLREALEKFTCNPSREWLDQFQRDTNPGVRGRLVGTTDALLPGVH